MFSRKPSPNTRKPRSFRVPVRQPQKRTAGISARGMALKGRMDSALAGKKRR